MNRLPDGEAAKHVHECAECGGDIPAPKRGQHFCGRPCRTAFNNRRAMRGAQLYDAFMTMRYERGWAKAVGLWQLVCRCAANWRADDIGARRASYIRPDVWVDANKALLTNADYGKVAGNISGGAK